MMTLPTGLANFMQGKNLDGLKPFALLYRNKWDSVKNKYALEDTPIDISALIAKPNTLSMTLDVNEVAQYNANNVTLTLSDTKNYFVEGTPNSYFPEGYQVYGSKVVLYYGLNTPINPYPTQVGYTVVGSPTITDGVASGFSYSNRLTITSNVTNASITEMVWKFKLDASGLKNKYNYIFFKTGGNLQIAIYGNTTNFSTPYIYLPGTNQSHQFTNFNPLPDVWYWVKYTYDGTTVRLYSSTDGTNYTLRKTIENVTITGTGGVYQVGWGSSQNPTSTQYFSGSIDINETYIKVNGEYWFNGAHFFWKNNSTPLFTGVIKELPTHKPEKYQVDVKLVSPLEMLKDIEAKDFSDKVTGKTLTYKSTDSEGHRIYWTTGTGVGGFDAVYANGTKLFEGVDYETDQLNALGLPAIVTIINSTYYSSTITADYYTWKTGLTVEQIVAGLVGLAGYDSGTEDIRSVAWNSSVRSVEPINNVQFALGYALTNNTWVCSWPRTLNSWSVLIHDGTFVRPCIFPRNIEINFSFYYGGNGGLSSSYGIMDSQDTSTQSGYVIDNDYRGNNGNYRAVVRKYTNGTWSHLGIYDTGDGTVVRNSPWKIVKQSNRYSFYYNGHLVATDTSNFDIKFEILFNYYDKSFGHGALRNRIDNMSYKILSDYGTPLFSISSPCIMSQILNKPQLSDPWSSINATLQGNEGYQYELLYSTSDDGINFSNLSNIALGSEIGANQPYLYFVLKAADNRIIPFNISDLFIYYLSSTLVLQLVNLSGSTVLEALQDFALISGYEFGVDRQGVFFFRPRVASITPTYILDHDEIVKVDTVKKNLSDFFTKLTLTFAKVPLEFYANTGERPTPIDKYGIINKEIDKPDIVNYDNPELAQAIGPQLLEVYSALPNVIQVTGKLNLAIELGDIVSLRRNMNLITPEQYTDYSKYKDLNTYYRACKITGMNYNFSKKQITYTLRDVSNKNTEPAEELYQFVYDFPVRLGKKK